MAAMRATPQGQESVTSSGGIALHNIVLGDRRRTVPPD
jgi:hypothetical protein